MNAKYEVCIIESERGWGQRVDEVKHFDSKIDADKFVKDYNAKNTSPVVPDWYMYASEPKLVDLDQKRS
jgi:hypothetical protein